MAKKDKKSKKEEQKARAATKQSKKTAKSEKKFQKKGKDQDSDEEEVDLDAVLAQYAEQQAHFLKVTEDKCEPPSPRSSSTILASPSNSNELLLFGGEHYNGAIATFFNDLFIYLIDRDEWRMVTSPNSPLPRSGHAWCRGGNAGGIYLFGGEFSSPKQGTFYHYNDFWRLDTSSREWTRLETKGKSPPGRSGHRMVYYKNYIILYGGFQDTSQQTRYLSDLWIYDCQHFVWHNPTPSATSQKPDPRSSFSFLPHESGAVIYGGYSRVKASTSMNKQTKGISHGTRVVLKPMVHQDTWFLRIQQPGPEAPHKSPPTIRWERRKRPANAPNPVRAGVTQAYHKGRGILFGGVHDVEESEEGIDSEFFDGLYAWNIERNRFFQLTLRRPRTSAKKQQNAASSSGGRRGRGKADEEELLRNLAALEMKGSIADADSVQLEKAHEEEKEEPAKPVKEVTMELPHPRFNAQLTVQDDVLYIFGGTFEKADREFTFDDMWAIDLIKLDGVKEIFKRELENWEGSEDEEEEDEEDESDSEGEDEDEGGEGASTPATSIISTPRSAPAVTVPDNDIEEEAISSSMAADSRPYPRPFESLREFYARTSEEWQNIILAEHKAKNSAKEKSIKELRKEGFELAEEKWWDCREEIRALEDEREQAGIAEVINLTDRNAASGGGGGAAARRR
ncbi:MAG: hypothetical protein M1834_008249 [Cirrosporium novae-zelandiae]|nr:MAG: hypothetical protein M1834_008249 [Cirrosporium novae-zelandiae]